MRILIAEDDNTSRLVLESVLRKAGHEVISTTDGAMALKELQKPEAPRLAILDWMMPEMDGIDVCRRVRAMDKGERVYILMLTALGNKSDIVSGLDAGANDYLTKPFNNEELRARIRVGRRVLELQEALSVRVAELEEALHQVKTLQGIIPICMHCHKIRNDEESWLRMERYVEDHSNAQFSHSICPECMEKYYPADDEELEEEVVGTAE